MSLVRNGCRRGRATGLALAAALLAAAPALAQTSVYRGIGQNADSCGQLAANQFNFNPQLSTFDNPAAPQIGSPCAFRFTIVGLAHNPPQQGDIGNVQGLMIQGNQAQALFDNVPPGHWSILLPIGVQPQQARQDVSQFARLNPVGNIVNATGQNCH